MTERASINTTQPKFAGTTRHMVGRDLSIPLEAHLNELGMSFHVLRWSESSMCFYVPIAQEKRFLDVLDIVTGKDLLDRCDAG